MDVLRRWDFWLFFLSFDKMACTLRRQALACTLRRQVCIFVEKGMRLKEQVQNRVGGSYRGLSSAASGGRRGEGGGDGEARFAGMRELRSSNELLSANCTRLLQERLAADGYLLFRELLDREAVLALRRRIREALHDLNWINSQQDSEGDLKVQAAPKETMKLDAHEWPIFDRVQKLEEFHALPHSAALIAALEKIFGESVLMHPRHICRVHFPAQEANRTLPHQDYPYVQGSDRFLTNWCPLGDVPAKMGPLAILVGSHKFGERRLMEGSDLAAGSNNAPIMVDTENLCTQHSCWWGTTDFRAGDVLRRCGSVWTAAHSHSPKKCRLARWSRIGCDRRGTRSTRSLGGATRASSTTGRSCLC